MSTVSEMTYYTTEAERMNTITAIQIPMRNGDTIYFLNQITLGEALVAVSIFLLLAFHVLKWLLNMAWRR
ncbi:hypothetical protein KIH86_04290 [Paenibacillus sp. HN-1]|uniref:hypothetical protein n=1 Tax=Paenibacillus TaxID=44249 RepID=UPI001CA8936B|nr:MULTISPECIES: hypothetical protein [Paenibacillus]MBY9082614.1 hypothetical protein [Paenibacillus sp. CGMCC 1.18879]MBY9083447.1 hypothetical protein [Paenibacillus sinensis]